MAESKLFEWRPLVQRSEVISKLSISNKECLLAKREISKIRILEKTGRRRSMKPGGF